MIKFSKILTIVILSQVFFSFSFNFNILHAEEYKPYEPLVAIPNINSDKAQESSDGLSKYLGNMYTFGVAIATLLAVIMIMWGGIEYMSTDSMGGKEGGKEKISNALFGLLLALGSYLILRTINQELLSTNLNIEPAPTPLSIEDETRLAALRNLESAGIVAPRFVFPNDPDYPYQFGDEQFGLPAWIGGTSMLTHNSPYTGDATNDDFIRMYKTGVAIDTDGRNRSSFFDPDYQAQTSYMNPDGTYLDANIDNYVVVPANSGIPLGTKVHVLNKTTGLSAWAIVGDHGPAIGEVSTHLGVEIGATSGTANSAADNHEIEYTFYTSSKLNQ